MKRRKFVGSAALLSLYASIRPAGAAVQAETEQAVAPADELEIDPYFLDSGEIPEDEQATIADFEQYRDRLAQGKEAILPRGGRPDRAPTHRFVHWNGEIGDPNGSFSSALSVKPTLTDVGTCKLNAQILGFRANSEDFRKKAQRGTLNIEFRARETNEKMTWLFVQQFDVFADGVTDLGMEYIASRNEVPQSVVLEEPIVDIRIQLLRHSTGGGFLRRILKIAGVVSGLRPVTSTARLMNATTALNDLREQKPSLRIPRLSKEGVALGQAVFSGDTKERPLWCSGYNSYSLTKRGGRMKLVPGIWVAIDESREVDMRGVSVADFGGRIVLARDGEPLDANYLILDFQIESDARGSRDVVPKGEPTSP